VSKEGPAKPTPVFPRFLHPLPGVREPKVPNRYTGRALLLTFDDGPDLVGTSMILDELNRRGLKAVFFVNGHHIIRNRPEDLARRDLLRKLALHGHLVGNHGLNHRNLCQEKDRMAMEIDGAAELIANTTGVRPLLFRSPYGARCRALDQALAERDVVQVGWNMDPQEWKGNDEDAVVDYVTKTLARIHGPMILLLHDKNLSTVHALPRILDYVAGVNRSGEEPIQVLDYRVFLPKRPMPDSGLGPLVDRFALALATLAR